MTNAARHDVFPAGDGLDAWRSTSLTVARVLVGGGSVIIGLVLGSTNPAAYAADWNVTLFSAMVIIGGVILLAQARRRPQTSRTAWIAGTAVTAGGLIAGAVAPVQRTCCDAVRTVALGLPMPWTTGSGDSWSQAVTDAWGGPWDPVSAIANVIFWGYAGMIVLVLVGLTRRATRHSVGARP
jgi:hypothetical protein